MDLETAAKRGCVPAEPFARIAQEWLGKQNEAGNPLGLLAAEMRVDKEGLRKIVTGKKEWISFDTADRLIGAIDPFLRLNDPEVRWIYNSHDLSYLDRTKPCAA